MIRTCPVLDERMLAGAIRCKVNEHGLIRELKMGMAAWQLAGHVAISILTLVTLALRIEHRITKIETDVSWLKDRYVKSSND